MRTGFTADHGLMTSTPAGQVKPLCVSSAFVHAEHELVCSTCKLATSPAQILCSRICCVDASRCRAGDQQQRRLCCDWLLARVQAYPEPKAGALPHGNQLLAMLGLVLGKALYEGFLSDVPLAPFFAARLQVRHC